MRDQIIKYLQGMQCEWFPVEWDLFANEFYLANGYQVENVVEKIKYSFGEIGYYVYAQYSNGTKSREYWRYATLNRCKTLLLNTVRSVDEPKRIAAGWGNENWWIYANDERI